jgi:hypothetical protein
MWLFHHTRAFIPVAASQGYQWISFFGRGKTPITLPLNTLFVDLALMVSRIIDIQTPGQNIHSILVHNDYICTGSNKYSQDQ